MQSLARQPKRLARTESALQFAAALVDGVEAHHSFDRSLLIHAFASVDRCLFVEPAFCSRAYEDDSLPIGFGQTISKPSTVARMLASLNLRSEDKVLEVGVGSAYVTALLASMNLCVYGMEILPLLARRARKRLDGIGLHRVLIKCGNGMKGWRDEAPFDAIIVSAACTGVPMELMGQLKIGGRLVAPLISRMDSQRLVVWQRSELELTEDLVRPTQDLGPCNFVTAAH